MQCKGKLNLHPSFYKQKEDHNKYVQYSGFSSLKIVFWLCLYFQFVYAL